MTENFRPTNLRAQAWSALKGKWGMAALAGLVLFVLEGFGQLPSQLAPHNSAVNLVSLLILLFFVSQIQIGASFLFLDVARGEDVAIETMFESFKSYSRYVVGYLIVFVLTMLWTLLLIVPGIIKSLSYSMTFFIMRENPDMDGNQARKLSMKMMEGHKMELFLLSLSFIGWILLGILTLCIGLFWIVPYIYTAQARFWETLKAEYRETAA